MYTVTVTVKRVQYKAQRTLDIKRIAENKKEFGDVNKIK